MSSDELTGAAKTACGERSRFCARLRHRDRASLSTVVATPVVGTNRSTETASGVMSVAG